uniref:MD-2-related lipid-recognition domain-containing protein n=1 Tax=Glossina palpalis gambiensis TaxID=67801 RepID=A0A1B0BFR7_9MUSC
MFKVSAFLILFYISNLSLKGFQAMVITKKTWTYELLSCTLESEDPDKFNGEIKVKHLTRTDLALTGFAELNYDIAEGDGNTIEVLASRSSTGSESDYQLLPYSVPRQSIIKFLNELYKDMIMNSLSECSNLPVFTDKFAGPVEKKRYELDNCSFSDEAFPNHLPEGFYRIKAQIEGEVQWSVVVNVQVMKKDI